VSAPYIAVCGPGEADPEAERIAEEIGLRLARAAAVVVCGGMTGVMEAACRGAKEGAGRTVGILPGSSRRDANRYVDVAIPTGMGEMRNALVVRAADVVIAVAGAFGTLSEIALALKIGRPVVGVATWDIKGIVNADGAEDAVRKALDLAAR
jgi:uncharacterized protein (TIGR00725 family)